MKITINYFKDTELFLAATLVNMFNRKYNHYLYLQYNTVFRFLTEDSQSYLRGLLLNYRNSLFLSEDTLDFTYYILQNIESLEFQMVCTEIDSLRKKGLADSTKSRSISDELFYTIQGYSKGDNGVYSIFEGSELHALSKDMIDFTLFSMSSVRFQLKWLLKYEITNFKTIESVLEECCNDFELNATIETTLMTFMLLEVYAAWKKEPKRLSWENIIYKALKADMDATKEVLEKCYMNF